VKIKLYILLFYRENTLRHVILYKLLISNYSLCLSIGCVVSLCLIFISFFYKFIFFFFRAAVSALSLSVRLILCCVTFTLVLCIVSNK